MTFAAQKLDDGWPESVEEQFLSTLISRQYITRHYIKDVTCADEKNSIKTQGQYIARQNSKMYEKDRKKSSTSDTFTRSYFTSFSHTNAFTRRRFYTQTLLHTDSFTHKHFYKQMLLHTDAFTHRRFYTQTLFHTNTFTHQHFYTPTLLHTETLLHTNTFCTQALLHTDAFPHRGFYTQTLLHTEAFTHGRFYTQTLLHTDAFTHRRFYTQTLLGCTHIESRSGFCHVLVLEWWCLVELNVPQAFGCCFVMVFPNVFDI